MKFIDLTGKKFNRLLVLSRAESNLGRTRWNCLCDCGNVKIINGLRLKNESSRSCGCLQKEQQSERIKKSNTIHGHNIKGAQSRTHKSWVSMHHRCRGKNYTDYHRYGGRGIFVWERWSDFKNFLEDMGERPENKTLDRIDVDWNYEPSNCRWATLSEQQKNKRCHKKC